METKEHIKSFDNDHNYAFYSVSGPTPSQMIKQTRASLRKPSRPETPFARKSK